LDGVGTNYIIISDSSDLDLDTDNWVLEVWIKPIEDMSQWAVIAQKKDSDTGYGWSLRYKGDPSGNFYQQLEFYSCGSGGTTWTYTDGTLDYGVWYHVTVVCSDGTIRFYIDGVEDTLAPKTNYCETNNVYMYIGTNAANTSFDGYVDEIRIHKRVLSAEEISSRYRSEPYLHDWYQMTRVYHKNHEFKGLPVITNGLVMLSFPDYDTYEWRANDILMPVVYGWYENSWHLLGIICPRFYLHGTDPTSFDTVDGSDFEIEELTDQYCKIRIRYYQSDNSSVPEGSKFDLHLIIRSGYPGIIVEKEKSDWHKGEWRQGFQFLFSNVYGLGTSKSFAYVPEDNIYSEETLAADQSINLSTCDDNWCILFDSSSNSNAPSKNAIIGACSDTDEASTNNPQFNLSYSAASKWYQLYVNQTKYGSIFFIPYDVDVVHKDGYELTDGATAGTPTAGSPSGYTETGTYKLNGLDQECYLDAGTLKKGLYYVKWRIYQDYEGGGQTHEIYVKESGGSNIITVDDNTSSNDEWFTRDAIFYADGDTDINIGVKQTSEGVPTELYYVDYIKCIPLSNGHDFPSDLANLAFNDTRLIRGLKR